MLYKLYIFYKLYFLYFIYIIYFLYLTREDAKKEPRGFDAPRLSSSPGSPRLSRRLPTLPLSQYHRRGEV